MVTHEIPLKLFAMFWAWHLNQIVKAETKSVCTSVNSVQSVRSPPVHISLNGQNLSSVSSMTLLEEFAAKHFISPYIRVYFQLVFRKCVPKFSTSKNLHFHGFNWDLEVLNWPVHVLLAGLITDSSFNAWHILNIKQTSRGYCITENMISLVSCYPHFTFFCWNPLRRY